MSNIKRYLEDEVAKLSEKYGLDEELVMLIVVELGDVIKAEAVCKVIYDLREP